MGAQALDYVRIRAAFGRAAKAAGLTEAAANDVAFHMTDWLREFEALYEVCEDPEHCSTEGVKDVLFDFLIHAPNHIAAAAKLLTDIGVKDIFGVDAVEMGKPS